MIIYIKETRRADGSFYRDGDWGIEKPDNWDNKKGNWTDKRPPEETLNYGIPCDFIDGKWVLDIDSYEFKNLYQKKRIYDEIGEQLDRLWHDIDKGKLSKTGQFYLGNKAVKDAFPKGE